MIVCSYIKYSDLYGKKRHLKDAVTRICNYGLINSINYLSRIEITLGHGYDDISKAQIPLLTKKLACPKIEKKYRDYLTKKASPKNPYQYFIFHPQQILNAMKLGLRYCTKIEKVTDVSTYERLVEALLIINDFLIPKKLRKHLMRKETELIRYAMMNILFHRLENEKNMIGRWQELIFKSYKDIDSGDVDFVDADNIFRSTYGVSPQDFFACCFGLYSFWRQLPDEDINKGVVALDFNSLKRDFNIDIVKFSNIINEICGTLDWYKRELSSDNEFTPYEFLPFQIRPILKHNNQLYCLSIKLLLERMTSGIYHMFFNCFEIKKDKLKFFRFIGKVYQSYVTNILQNEYNEMPETPRFIKPFKYWIDKQEIEWCDGIIDYGDRLIVIEMKASLFTHNFLTQGTLTEFKSKLKDIIFDASIQLERTIEHFRSKIFTIKGIEPNDIKKYYPVIISLQPIPMEKYLYNFIHQQLRMKNLLQSKDIESIEIVSTYGLENILAIMKSGMSFVDIIKEKHNIPQDKMESMENFLIRKYPNVSKVPDYIDRGYKVAKKHIFNFWKPKNKKN